MRLDDVLELLPAHTCVAKRGRENRFPEMHQGQHPRRRELWLPWVDVQKSPPDVACLLFLFPRDSTVTIRFARRRENVDLPDDWVRTRKQSEALPFLSSPPVYRQ